jgi:hypothetical protein
LWDLRKALIKQLGQTAGLAQTDTLFVGVLQRAPDIPGSYLAALIADDDDGNLGNGTPHGCTIEAVFGRHGLAGVGYQPPTIGVPVVTGTTFTVPVIPPVGSSCPPAQVTSVELRWRTAGGADSTVAFTPSGTTWVGALPPLPDGSLVSYTIAATFDDDTTITYPDNPADPRYQLYVGTPTEIWCERFDTDPQWPQTGTMDWQWGAPASISVSGDPTAAYSGTHVFGTRLTGDGRYASDAVTTVSTPAIDTSAFTQVHLQYRRWLTVEDALYDQATKQGWTIISMKDDWKKIFAFD